MTNATAAGVASARMEVSAYVTLWITLTAILLCGAACLWVAGLQADFGSTLLLVEPATVFVLLGCMFSSLSNALYKFRILRQLAATFEDFFLSTAQMTGLAAVSGLLVYLAANAGARFPMRDDTLEYFDALLGFNWHVISHWIADRPTLDAFLLYAYQSLDLQITCLLFLGSALHTRQRNKEFISLFLVSIIITSIIFIFVPAFGMFGRLDENTLDRLLDIRAGQSIMTYNCVIGIITFPSYHTVLAVLITYSARYRYWSFVPALFVNIIMLTATSPEGGHYLIDMLAGAVVAMLSILIVRRCFSNGEPWWSHTGRTTWFERRIGIVGSSAVCPQASISQFVTCRRDRSRPPIYD